MISLAGSSASRLRSFECPAVSGDGLAQRGEPLVVFKLVASQDVGEAFWPAGSLPRWARFGFRPSNASGREEGVHVRHRGVVLVAFVVERRFPDLAELFASVGSASRGSGLLK